AAAPASRTARSRCSSSSRACRKAPSRRTSYSTVVFWVIATSPDRIEERVMSTHRHSLIRAVCGALFGALLTLPAAAQDRDLGAGGELLESVAAVVDNGLV